MPDDAGVKKCVEMERDRFVVLDGLLHYYVNPARKDRARLVVPEGLREKLLQEIHEGAFAGHLSVKGVYGKLCRRYWWKGMYSDVYKFCKGCLTCAAYRGRGEEVKSPLEVYTRGWSL